MSGSSALTVLWPAEDARTVPDGEAGDALLRELYGYRAEGCWVRANMVSTLDGAGAGPDGRTGSVNTAADRRVFAILRSLADLVLVGAGTVRAEGYGMPDGPQLAVVTRAGNVPARLLSGKRRPVVVTTGSAGAETLRRLRDAVGTDAVVLAGDQDVDLTDAIDALQDKGFDWLLCEGGPSLLADLVASGELDELCLTWSPVVTGGGAPRILDGGRVDVRFELGHLLHADGALLGRWLVR